MSVLRGNARAAQAVAPYLDRVLQRLQAKPNQIPKQVLTRAEQSLKERCQKICEQADRLHDDAQMASDYMARNKILHKRLITTGKSLGECLADAAKMKSYAVAENIFDSYKQRFSAKAYHYNALLGLAPQEQTFAIFKEMLTKKVLPDVRSFSVMFDRCRDESELSHLLELLSQQKMRPDIVACTAMVRSVNRIRGAEQAFKMFEEIDRWCVKPDNILYSVLLDIATRSRNHVRSRQIIERIRESGLVPDIRLEAMMKSASGAVKRRKP